MLTAASQPRSEPRCLILMGVAGCGKSSVGEMLAPLIGAQYRDGDDMHPPQNIAKMSNGQPLNDTDRWPWLGQIGETFAATAGRQIIGCSALKRIYRDRIHETAGEPVLFVHLAGSRDVIEARMSQREGHFMPTSLLDSQFADLELPAADEMALSVDIDQALAAVVREIEQGLGKDFNDG